MKKPAKGWKTPNAWLLWKMQGWTLEQIKIAFQVLAQAIPGRMVTKVWHTAMHADGYYGRLVAPDLLPGPFDNEVCDDEGTR